MTVNAVRPVSGPHIADGTNRNWSYNFKIFEVGHMALFITDADGSNGIEVFTGFTIAAPGIDNDAGGTVVYPVAPVAALASGKRVVPFRVAPYDQSQRIGNQGAYFPETHERAMDDLSMQVQQIEEEGYRAVKVDRGQTPLSATEFLAAMDDAGDAAAASAAAAAGSAASADADRVQTGLDRTAVAADKATVAADKAIVAADKGTVAADKAIVAADKGTVAADKAIVLGYRNEVEADRAEVETNKNTVAADKAIVAADKATVAADKAIVAADKATASAAASASVAAALDSETARDDAYDWSSAAEDDPVNDGTHAGFSAYHWSKKAEAAAGGGVNSVAAAGGGLVEVDNTDAANPILDLTAGAKSTLSGAVQTGGAAALSVLGRSANSVGDRADIAAGTDGHVLRRSGTTLGFGTILSAAISDLATTITTAIAAAVGVTVQAFDAALSSKVRQNSKSAAYTLVLSDDGKHIFHPSADTTARIWTIPANATVAFSIGTAITFVNQNGAGVITIAITTDTMRLAGAGTTGSRTLAANGMATALKVTATEWIIGGTGLT
jgi:hypothetical protein